MFSVKSNIKKKDLKKETKDILNKIGDCDDVKTLYPTEYTFLENLLKKHPDNKAKNMVNIITKKKFKEYVDVYFIDDNGNEQSISCNKCITGHKTSNREKLLEAMRYSIKDQIINFKNTSKLECVICNTSGCECPGNRRFTHEFHVDHIIFFSNPLISNFTFFSFNTIKVTVIMIFKYPI